MHGKRLCEWDWFVTSILGAGRGESIGDGGALVESQDEMVEVGTFPNLRKYVIGGGPLYVSRGILIKIMKNHHRRNGMGLIRWVLQNFDFAVRYKKGVINFYSQRVNHVGEVRYYLVGVSVRDKVITTAYPIRAVEYEKAFERRIK